MISKVTIDRLVILIIAERFSNSCLSNKTAVLANIVQYIFVTEKIESAMRNFPLSVQLGPNMFSSRKNPVNNEPKIIKIVKYMSTTLSLGSIKLSSRLRLLDLPSFIIKN